MLARFARFLRLARREAVAACLAASLLAPGLADAQIFRRQNPDPAPPAAAPAPPPAAPVAPEPARPLPLPDVRPAQAPAPDVRAPNDRAEIQITFAQVVRRVTPAVVNVFASRKSKDVASPMFDDPFFRRFLEDNGGGGQGGGGLGGMPRERVQSSLGSGVIVDRAGFIVTNNHVIENATEVKIALSDRREFECDIVLKDERTDLAILKIKERGDFPTLDIGDSDALEVGDLVLAIGNPFGVGQTVTQGIVSALARSRVGQTDFQFFIQTDAAINPGNSGGALIDVRGRLVGINTAILSRSGGSVGIGFAIPVNMVRVVLGAARAGEKTVRRPWFGAQLQPITPDLAESMKIPRLRGAIVAGVQEGGPAARAGIRSGDVLVGLDTMEVEDPDAFGFRFATKPLGGRAQVVVLRGGRQQTFAVELIAAPEQPPRDERRIEGFSPFTGAHVVNLSPAVAEELKLAGSLEGVVIREVEPGGQAARLGFQRGDIVLEVNGTRIDSTRTLVRVTNGDPGLWRLSIMRQGQIMRLAFRS